MPLVTSLSAGYARAFHANTRVIYRLVNSVCLMMFLCMTSPPLHLTTSKVVVIVWRLRENITRTVFIYCQRATSSMGTVNKNSSSHSPVGPCVSLRVLGGRLIYFYVCLCCVLPWTVESFPFMLWRWRNKLKWAPFKFLLPPHYCGLGAGSIPLRAIVNKQQCERRGLFMTLVIHCWTGDVQDSQGAPIPQNVN